MIKQEIYTHTHTHKKKKKIKTRPRNYSPQYNTSQRLFCFFFFGGFAGDGAGDGAGIGFITGGRGKFKAGGGAFIMSNTGSGSV